jgi:hypothetical protein
MNVAGSILLILGFSLVAYGLAMSGAPQYSDTLNIGLLNDKSNIVNIGGFCFVSGIILFAAETIRETIERNLNKLTHEASSNDSEDA